MIESVQMVMLLCDGCRAPYEFEADGEGVTLWDNAAEAERHVDHLGQREGEWTTDGEGRAHCPECPPLKLTEEGAAIAARRPGPNDVPLPDLEAL